MTADPDRSPAMLAANADRDRATDVLKAALAEGRLSKEEHDDRVGQVHTARTYDELAAIVGDLPAGPLGGIVPNPGAEYLPQTSAPAVFNSLAVASLVCGIAELPTLGLTAVPAVILGNRARQQIRETGERGEGLAVTGLVLGWIVLACFFAAIVVIMIWLMLPAGPGTSGPIGS